MSAVRNFKRPAGCQRDGNSVLGVAGKIARKSKIHKQDPEKKTRRRKNKRGEGTQDFMYPEGTAHAKEKRRRLTGERERTVHRHHELGDRRRHHLDRLALDQLEVRVGHQAGRPAACAIDDHVPKLVTGPGER